MDSMGDLQDGMRETFAFEIRVANDADDVQNTNIRSYFSRVDTSELCDEWINEIKSAVKKVKHMRSERFSTTVRMQAKAKSVADSTAWRCAVALAIFINFVCSVVEAEYLPAADSPMGVLVDGRAAHPTYPNTQQPSTHSLLNAFYWPSGACRMASRLRGALGA